MSQYTSGYPVTPTATDAVGEQPTAQVARDEAGEVARTAADAGRQVAATATEQAKTVGQEATAQARDLVGEARGQVQEQARNGQQKATDGIRALVQELREMAEGAQQSGSGLAAPSGSVTLTAPSTWPLAPVDRHTMCGVSSCAGTHRWRRRNRRAWRSCSGSRRSPPRVPTAPPSRTAPPPRRAG